jgi:hypothetical protein
MIIGLLSKSSLAVLRTSHTFCISDLSAHGLLTLELEKEIILPKFLRVASTLRTSQYVRFECHGLNHTEAEATDAAEARKSVKRRAIGKKQRREARLH